MRLKKSAKMLPILHLMPRVERDIERCVSFVGRQPWGKPADRKLDIFRGIAGVRAHPGSNRSGKWLDVVGIELRCANAAQFVILYAYLPSGNPSLPDVVSIRAVRHRRVKNVFSGVKEPTIAYSQLPAT